MSGAYFFFPHGQVLGRVFEAAADQVGEGQASDGGNAGPGEHDPDPALVVEVRGFAPGRGEDEVVVLDEGRVAQIGTPAELERRPATRFAAAFVGTNLVRAMRHGDTVELAPGVRLPVSAGGSDGPVDLVVSPRHVRVSAGRTNPAEHEWLATIAGIEAAGDDVHVRLSTPVPIAARASFEAVRGLDLVPGAQVLVHVDLDAVTVHDTPSPFLPTPT